MSFSIRQMTREDYDRVIGLWRMSEGVGLSAEDERGPVSIFLERNPGLSFVATVGAEIVGTCLAGHDGRRGYIHHLAVAGPHRGTGIGRALAEAGLAKPRRLGQGLERRRVEGANLDRPDLARPLEVIERRQDLIVGDHPAPDNGHLRPLSAGRCHWVASSRTSSITAMLSRNGSSVIHSGGAIFTEAPA